MSFGNDFEDDKGDISEINMTPLVDVMLVLLIIFILAVPVITNSVKVDLPTATSQPTQAKPDVITLSVTADGGYLWNDDAISVAELDQRLASEAQKQPQPEVHIRGDKKVAYEHVLELMANVQKAGLQKLGFISNPSK